MHPALDEVQQALNKAVQNVISVSGAVAQWSKERKRIVKPGEPIPWVSSGSEKLTQETLALISKVELIHI